MASLHKTDDIIGNITQRDIFRLSAVLYQETNSSISTKSILADIIKCVLCEQNNNAMSEDDIIAAIASRYKFYLSREELSVAIRSCKNTFEVVTVDGQKKYKLTSEAFAKTSKSMENSIDSYIDVYFEKHPTENAEQGKYAIHKYLYELTTSNINSYKVLFGNTNGDTFFDNDLSVDVRELDDHERELVHDFVSWDNPEKNVVLANLVYCCLEYCLLVNGDQANPLIRNSIRKRTVYLDTNIIFRALGINGLTRKKVMTAFLKKCNQAGLSLIIIHDTEKEFEDTVKYYISQIKSYPRGRLFLGAIEQISDYNMFSFYDEWREKHENLSLDYFSKYINSLYLEMCKTYKIIKDQKVPVTVSNSESFKGLCNRYARGIKARKLQVKEHYISEDAILTARDKHDAIIVSYIEYLRDSANKNEEIFMASSDKALRYWDMTRKRDGIPVVVYPSQLFLILIKICGRSDNDFESFVSFINIRPRSRLITAEKANIILSGISSITEDLQTQKLLVDSIFGDDFQSIIQHSPTDQDLYQNVQFYSENYLDEQLKDKETLLQEIRSESLEKDERIISLSESIENVKKKQIQQTEEIEKIKESEKEKEVEIEKNREKICLFAEKKIKPKFIMKWYVFPILTLILAIVFAVFIISQFVFCDKSWNLANIVFSYVTNTTFGKSVNSYVSEIDAGLFALVSVLVGIMLKINPLNCEKKEEDKQKMIEAYINKNNLA